MASVKKHGCQSASVSASELAQMGVCERLVVFEHRYGRRRTAEQQRTAMRGLRAHNRFYWERHGDSVRRGGCFVATLVFESQDMKTMLLRRFGYGVSRLWQAWRSLIRRVVQWFQAAESRDGP